MRTEGVKGAIRLAGIGLGVRAMDDVIREFVVESNENLQRTEHEIVLLEKDPANSEIIANIFRTIHTIKGTCGFFDFAGLEAVTHAGENLLSLLRDQELEVDSEITNALLALVDVVSRFLANIEATGTEGEIDTSELIERLSGLSKGAPTKTAAAAPTRGPGRRKPRKTKSGSSRRKSTRAGSTGSPKSRSANTGAEDGPSPPAESTGDALDADPAYRQGDATGASVRLDVGLLDSLMSMVGELVLVRNQIVELVAEREDAPVASVSQRLNMVTTRLQEAVMRTRMQPIDTVFCTLPRLVRDLAVAGGKRVRLHMEGSDTELDRTIIEAIKDPLTHLVRNAVDHGIELPDTRQKGGKPDEGRVGLVASHENGQVIISISDDGAGIDVERIRKRALELSLVDGELLRRAGDDDVLQLVFSPGLSTADKVTKVSGRGVGLDVVRNNIEKIGGFIDLTSAPNEGTTVRIRLPMTLAIIQALMVRARGQRFAIPQLSTMELVRLGGDQAGRGIEQMHGAPVLRLRDKLLPIVDLGGELSLQENPESMAENSSAADHQTVVVLRANERDFGLVVDGVDETQEIVVKPLGRLLRRIPILAGTTILGDGRVALILDVPALAQRARVISERTDTTLKVVEEERPDVTEPRQALLLFATPDDGRMAIPLTRVAHLDKIERAAVEHTGELDVTQYRGEILPLIYVNRVLPERRSQPRRTEAVDQASALHVVVHSANGRRIGLVVDRIIDIVEETVELQRPGTRDCVLGTMVIRDRITEILDLEKVVHHAELTQVNDLPAASGSV
jgi:two-component system chemotaxis sensor kinase CheA